jgi:hypothetical protein
VSQAGTSQTAISTIPLDHMGDPLIEWEVSLQTQSKRVSSNPACLTPAPHLRRFAPTVMSVTLSGSFLWRHWEWGAFLSLRSLTLRSAGHEAMTTLMERLPHDRSPGRRLLLTRLDLDPRSCGNWLAAGGEALSTRCVNLTSLTLMELKQEEALQLPLLTSLRHLEARRCVGVSLAGITTGLARLSPHVEVLKLGRCPAMTPPALKAVTSHLRGLRVLHVTDAGGLTDDCLILALRHLGRLRELGLSGCRRMTPEGLWMLRGVLPGLATTHMSRTLCSAPDGDWPSRPDPGVPRPRVKLHQEEGGGGGLECQAGCGARLRRVEDQADHLHVCPAALRACPVDGCPERAPYAAMVNHIPACGHWRVQCYLCGEVVVRSGLGAHLECHRREDRGRDLVELPRAKWSLPPRDYDMSCPVCGETVRLSGKGEHPCLARDVGRRPPCSVGYGVEALHLVSPVVSGFWSNRYSTVRFRKVP